MEHINAQEFYTFIQSEQTARDFLRHAYQKMGVANFDTKSYENCQTFLYYLKHGLHFYETSKRLSTIIQPILLFYGMVHLIKASLLIKRPDYPESTKLLAHGVSSRKRKKRDYTFMEDEVTIHRNGLYSYFSEHLYQLHQPAIKSAKMKDLFTLIPEMSSLLSLYKQPIMSTIGHTDTNSLIFNKHLLDDYHLTSKAFINQLSRHLPSIEHTSINKEYIQIKISTPIAKSFGPFFLHMTNQTIHFPASRQLFFPISELMVHYLLLYNLSMISRYETEWWGDLLTSQSDIDFPLIKHFLRVSAKKVPLLLGNEMYRDYLTYVTH